MSYTIPSDTHTAGDTGHPTDHNNIADVLTRLDAVFAPDASNHVTNPVTFTQAVTAGVSVLAFAATITINAQTGGHFRVTLTGNTTFAAPLNPADGQKITIEPVQDATGSRTAAWNAAFNFGSAGAPTLTTTASKRDLLGFVYSSSAAAWLSAGIMQGF